MDITSVPVVRKLSHLPIIVDPSHAAGKRDFVCALATAGVAAGARHDHRSPLQPGRGTVRRPAGSAAGDVPRGHGPAPGHREGDGQAVPGIARQVHRKIGQPAVGQGKEEHSNGTCEVCSRQLEDEHEQGPGHRTGQGRGPPAKAISGVEIGVAAPFVYLDAVGQVVNGTNVMLGARMPTSKTRLHRRDLRRDAQGPRREVLPDRPLRTPPRAEGNPELVGKKADAIYSNGLILIHCVGEKLEERDQEQDAGRGGSPDEGTGSREDDRSFSPGDRL